MWIEVREWDGVIRWVVRPVGTTEALSTGVVQTETGRLADVYYVPTLCQFPKEPHDAGESG
jgi:hypothetical protein